MNYDEAIRALKEVSGIVSYPEHNHLIEKISTAISHAKKENELLMMFLKYWNGSGKENFNLLVYEINKKIKELGLV